mmetsp:Transcript_18587/g.28925  ORF Transcript_18587/g.28925 Transcript_18587/m.28925 type:complete len:250 (+) Transcript_18587:2726-3475(+)
MEKRLVLFIGPPGSGKTTHSTQLFFFLKAKQKPVSFINLDCGKNYRVNFEDVNIIDLIKWEEIVYEMHLGPNAAILFSFEYLKKNLFWIEKNLFDLNFLNREFYLILDLPGQIELFSHYSNLKYLSSRFDRLGFKVKFLLLNDYFTYKDPSVSINILLTIIGIHLNLAASIYFILTKSEIISDSTRSNLINKEIIKIRENSNLKPFEWAKKIIGDLTTSREFFDLVKPTIFDFEQNKSLEKIFRFIKEN